MIKGETKSGFKFEIDENALDDMELVEDLVKVDKGNEPSALVNVIVRLLGSEQKAALYEHVRDAETGRVPGSAVMVELDNIMSYAAENNELAKK